MYASNQIGMAIKCKVLLTLGVHTFTAWFAFTNSDPPSVSVSEETVTTNQTDPVSFSCEAFGIPRPQLHWLSSKSPSQMLEEDPGLLSISFSSFTNDSGMVISTSVVFINMSTRSDHEANYTCVAENGVDNYISTPETATTQLFVQGIMTSVQK